MHRKLFSLFILIAIAYSVNAQVYEVPKKEFRGVWIATVINLDWPQTGGLAPRFQKADLVSKLDELKEAGINAVLFQVRTEGDALYDSDIEPWSKYLTGEEGKAPDPYWDPLAFAIEEAHKRGMELHAWLNPYRAMRTIPSDFTQKAVRNESREVDESLKPFLDKEYDINLKDKTAGTSERDTQHVSNKHPEWLMVMNNSIAIFDPGLPEVMEYNLAIVMDIVNRYDVDGIHFDDYFYPYPPNQMSSNYTVDGEILVRNDTLDDKTFELYPRGFTDKDDWRRNNVDLFVEMIYDSIQIVKPWVKFGISPFGIWKNNVPTGIGGLDAYSVIYGDGLAWLEQQTIDYITPQLYWKIERFRNSGQDYFTLADWWTEQAVTNNRHIYPGHGAYRTDANTSGGALFEANEMPRQIRHNRENQNILGSVFFRAKNITSFSSKGFKDSLMTNYYKYEALPPTLAWKDTTQPAIPQNLIVNRDQELEYIFNLSWDKPEEAVVSKVSATGHVDSLIKYAIYRVDSSTNPEEASEMELYYNLVGVTGETTFTDIAPPSQNSHWYFVTAVSRNNVESEPTESVEGGIVVSNEDDPLVVLDYKLSQNYPNPFNPSTTISFSLGESGFTTLKVYDLLGREVRTLVEENRVSGRHEVSFNAKNLSSGIYFYELRSNGIRLIRKMTLLK